MAADRSQVVVGEFGLHDAPRLPAAYSRRCDAEHLLELLLTEAKAAPDVVDFLGGQEPAGFPICRLKAVCKRIALFGRDDVLAAFLALLVHNAPNDEPLALLFLGKGLGCLDELVSALV